MTNETIPYKVTGGKVLEAIHSFLETRNKQLEARNALAKEFGASGYVSSSGAITAFSFDGEHPKGWIQNRKDGGHMPTAKTPEGKALRERMKLPQWGASKFHEMMGLDDFTFMQGMRMRYISFEKLGDVFVMHIPKIEKPGKEDEESGLGEGHKWTPPDDGCQPLKMSEYWQLKESHPA
jgi:hypothetical protein